MQISEETFQRLLIANQYKKMKIISLFPLIAFALATTLPSTIFGNRFAVSNCMHKYCLILEANITGTLEYHNTV
jgi:hypothetical protein